MGEPPGMDLARKTRKKIFDMLEALIAAYFLEHGSCAKVEKKSGNRTEIWLVPYQVDSVDQLQQIMNASKNFDLLASQYFAWTNIPPSEAMLVYELGIEDVKIYYQKR